MTMPKNFKELGAGMSAESKAASAAEHRQLVGERAGDGPDQDNISNRKGHRTQMSSDFRLALIKQLALMRVEIHALHLAVKKAGIDDQELKAFRETAEKDIHRAEGHFAENLPPLS